MRCPRRATPGDRPSLLRSASRRRGRRAGRGVHGCLPHELHDDRCHERLRQASDPEASVRARALVARDVGVACSDDGAVVTGLTQAPARERFRLPSPCGPSGSRGHGIFRAFLEQRARRAPGAPRAAASRRRASSPASRARRRAGRGSAPSGRRARARRRARPAPRRSPRAAARRGRAPGSARPRPPSRSGASSAL